MGCGKLRSFSPYVPLSVVTKGGLMWDCSGRAYSPRFLWMWPQAKIGVMGPEQLTAVMEAVGKTVDPELKARIERESDAVYSSARLWDDGVIPPAHTRRVLAMGWDFAMSASGKGREREIETRFGVFRM